MADKKQKTIKVIIIILAILLALSLVALVGTLIHKNLAVHTDTTVTVPDNIITPEADNDNQTSENDGENTSVNVGITDNKTSATTIALYNKQPQDNTAFAVGNMFPGDVDTKYYGVQVSYHDKVTVHFGAEIRNGYEKLAEVMKVKVTLLNTDEVMYDGLMRDMPESVTYKLTSPDSTTDELYYEITAYLDTAVGNEYQNKDLIADFKWWVEETGNLDKAPQTSDTYNIILWSLIVALSALALLVLLQFRRKKEEWAK